MTSTESSGQILKTDALARVRTPASRRRELLEEFDRSGLSGAKFAALAGIKYSTFATWAAKRHHLHAPDPPLPAQRDTPAAEHDQRPNTRNHTRRLGQTLCTSANAA